MDSEIKERSNEHLLKLRAVYEKDPLLINAFVAALKFECKLKGNTECEECVFTFLDEKWGLYECRLFCCQGIQKLAGLMDLIKEKNKWEPKSGDRVIYKNPVLGKECGLFVVCKPIFQDEENLSEDYCIISYKVNKARGQPAEIRERELKRRLEPGPEKPCAKFCKDRNCEFYKPRECSGIHECTLKELTPSNLNICPKDEEELNNKQFIRYGDFPRNGGEA